MNANIIFINLIFTFIIIFITACATDETVKNNERQSSILERIPIVYRQDIQQGNVITQNMVNQLHPGLSKRQVRFIMGTPILIDMFHQSRWDYVYTITHGWGDTNIRVIQLYFNDQEQLEHIVGDIKPPLNINEPVIEQEVLVNVPDYEDPDPGVLKQAVNAIGNVFNNDQ
jgi:outer membrane protein assembly factor BamE